VVGEVDVGADDAARLLEPEPHIPDIPDVSSVPEEPEFTGSSDVKDVADKVDVVDVAAVPEFAAVAGIAVPIPMPPPSKLAVEPNISEGDVATVEHAVLVVVVGMVIVPVTPVGSGLTPGEVISVEPSGIPAGEPEPPIATPSGEVAPIVGVGVTVPSNCPSTCAIATLQTKSAGRIAATSNDFTNVRGLKAALPATPGCDMEWLPSLSERVLSLPAADSVSLRPGRWTARSACSIKYAFMVLAPMEPRLDAECDCLACACSGESNNIFS
jgi:hypothetical protein